MVLLVKLISIALVIYGCLIVLKPSTLKKAIRYIQEGNRIQWLAGIRFVLGILLILAAPYCAVVWVVRFFGAVSAFSGILPFLIKKTQIDKMLSWWINSPTRYSFYAGLLILLVGVLLIISA